MGLRFREKQLRVTRSAGGDVVYYLIEDTGRGVQHRLYEVEFEVARLLDGVRGPEKVARLINKRRKINLTEVDVDHFARQLLALGFAEEI